MKILFIVAVIGGIIFALSRKKGKVTKSMINGTPYKSGGINPTDNSSIIPNQDENTKL